MRKNLEILAVLLATVIIHGRAQTEPLKSQEHDQPKAHQTEPTDCCPCADRRVSLTCLPKEKGQTGNQASSSSQDPSNDHPADYAKLGFYVSGVVALITFVIAIASLKQASAAKLGAQAIIDSERAWMIAEIRPISMPRTRTPTFKIAPRLRNKGKTPAFILEMANATIVLAVGEPLPKTIAAYPQVTKFDGYGVPVAPENDMGGEYIGTFQDAEAILKGYFVLWVFGYVKYHDTFLRTVRETRYCFRWEVEEADYTRAQFLLDGPEGYNRAT